MTGKPLSEIDRNFKRKEIGGRELEFHTIPSGPMELGGFAWYEKEKVFCRLPQDSLPKMNEGVQALAWHTSGGTIRFRTDSPTIAISVELDSAEDMNHMPRTGSGGFDLYLGLGSDMRFTSGSSYPSGSKTVEGLLDDKKPNEMRDGTIYFPLYSGVASARLGLTPGCEIQAPVPLTVQAPLLFYGSSVTQGGCASRPGNAYTSIVPRWLNANFINLGFSGSAKGDPAMAEMIASMTMSVFIMDYDYNAPSPEHLHQTHHPFFQIIRDAQPNLPVVFVTRPDFHDYDHELQKSDRQRLEIVRDTYQAALDAGDRNVYFVDGSTLFGEDDRDACTVDGCHPNDLGFYRMARGIAPAVREALKNADQ